ncbi:MAG: hypothetical protein IBX47_12440 [Desulfuromonadales bacterium]|nr:hypothetical protein [Desulfuromonadales bacterium]
MTEKIGPLLLYKIASRPLFLALLLIIFAACTGATVNNADVAAIKVPILHALAGDLPVSGLISLPKQQRSKPIGYLASQQQLDEVMRYFQADAALLPAVDFTTQLVLFTRNTVYYNRLSIVSVDLVGETLKVVSVSTLSAMPIQKRIAMSLVVIPRQGAKYLDVAGEKIRIDFF